MRFDINSSNGGAIQSSKIYEPRLEIVNYNLLTGYYYKNMKNMISSGVNGLTKTINKKIDGVIWHLITTGTVFLFLAVLVVWTEFMSRLVVGFFILLVAYIFFYLSFRFWEIKKELDKYLKF